MGVLDFVLGSFWFLLPAYFANMAPVFMPDWLKLSNVRLDFGKSWKGKPILGAHKTLHGLFWAVVWGSVIGWGQTLVCESYAVGFCSSVPIGWQIGGMLGLGAIIGDSVKSFFKRRSNVKAGGPWFPWDQIDYVLGAFVFFSLYSTVSGTNVRVGWEIWAFLVIVAPITHTIANRIGYWLGWKEVPW